MRLTIADGKHDPLNEASMIRWFSTHNGISKERIVQCHNLLYDRLVKYENTGLEPEEVTELRKWKQEAQEVARCAVSWIDKEISINGYDDSSSDWLRRIRELVGKG